MLVTKNNKILSHSECVNPSTLYHLVDLSPWPLTSSFSLFTMAIGAAMTFNNFYGGGYLILTGFSFLVLSAICWWRDAIREGFQGHHTKVVIKGLKLGFALFVISEIFLFIAFFWAMLHSSLSPNVELGCTWPPAGIEPIDPWVVPLLNALVLLSSGVSVTWAHHSVIKGSYKEAIKALILTILLAVIFCFLMVAEYYTAGFTIADSVYGSSFYMLTGLHGLHMIVGIIFLSVGLYRLASYHFSSFSCLGLELAIIYYHFVDLVFLFVFTICYWWSSGASFS
ncbi:MAG: cytochrome c oxidase subunit 3 [Rickettsiales bacterium]|nr:MAG: cytochrome c oxidase subunit 3 [Rickettsiales bacterium]